MSARLLAAAIVVAYIALMAIIGLPLAWPHGALAAETLPGPIPADVVRVIDGDTMVVDAVIWLDVRARVSVRLRDIDAPELRGPRCAAERDAATRARARLAELAGARVFLFDVAADKYAERVDARVAGLDGRAIAPVLIAEGLGRAYAGGRRQGWCP